MCATAGVVLALVAGCGGSAGRDATEPTSTVVVNPRLAKLKARLGELGGQEAYPVVSLELFFVGNDDVASIGPNLDPHPGVETFYRVLHDIRERPEVSDVVLQVSEVLDGEGEWPFVEAAYVITTASEDQVHEWARPLQPDPPVEEGLAWLYASPPPGAPRVPPGHRVVTLYWD
jgi:hypothetical protein